MIGLANAGADTINAVKQAAEFGLTRRGTKLAVLLMFINDVHGLGLQAAQGLVCTETFYWDLNDRTRAFTAQGEAAAGRQHAGDVACRLLCRDAALPEGRGGYGRGRRPRRMGAAAVARMKAMPTDDDCFGAGSIRADGRKIHPSYLFEVKAPEREQGRPGTTTSCCRPRRPRRPSGRWPRAPARWSAARHLAPWGKAPAASLHPQEKFV